MYNDFSGSKNSGDFIIILKRCGVTRVETKDILYIEKELRSICIHTLKEVHVFYGKMEDIADSLGATFFKCHKSCILNFERVTSMKSGVFYFEGGNTLMIGINNYQITKKRYLEFLNNRL